MLKILFILVSLACLYYIDEYVLSPRKEPDSKKKRKKLHGVGPAHLGIFFEMLRFHSRPAAARKELHTYLCRHFAASYAQDRMRRLQKMGPGPYALEPLAIKIRHEYHPEEQRRFFGLLRKAMAHSSGQQSILKGQLRVLAHCWDIPPSQVFIPFVTHTLGDLAPFELLGVKRDATEQTIKAAYREAVKKFHPDRWAAQSVESQQRAAAEFRKIQQAYESIQAIRQFK